MLPLTPALSSSVFQPSFDSHPAAHTPSAAETDVRAEQQAVDGQSIDVQTMDGQTMGGQSMDGQSMDGHAMGGHATGQSAVPARPGRLRSLAHAPATYLLLGINIAVYLLMILRGVDPLTPTPEALVTFGATYPAAVLAGQQWWRVVTAMFVHVGLVHLALNMWCLWNLGIIGEPLMGFFGTCAVYLLTGAAGNLLSVAASLTVRQGAVGAGASGAVFGIAGVLIVLFSNRRLAEPRPGFRGIPLRDLHGIRRSVIQFAALNLIIGAGTNVAPLMRSIHLEDIHIDNWAHIGGFVSGLAIAVPLVPRMTSGRERYLRRQKVVFAAAVLVLALFGYFLNQLR